MTDFRTHVAQLEAEVAAFVMANLALAGGTGCVRLISSKKEDVSLIVAPNTTKRGIWNLTRFIENLGPTGHHEFASREQAIRAASGESFSEHVAGPPYYDPGEFAVSRI